MTRVVLHRDIKPGNVLIFGRVPRIADFGIARQLDSDGTTLTRTAEQLGTFRYIAPEQLQDVKRVGTTADVYSLGKLLCHLLSGILPEPFKVNLRGVPSEYRHFIDKCCRDHPGQRFEHGAAALARFRRVGTPIRVTLPPLDQGRELAEAAEAAINTDSERASIESLAEHFRAHTTDRELYMSVLAQTSAGVIEAWIQSDIEGFALVLRAYDAMLTESNLRFGYCDMVARFYRTIFRVTADVGLKRLTMTTLIVMGHEYNRFFVHDLVADLLAQLSDPCDVEVAEEIIQEHERAASWYAATALKTKLAVPIADALEAARQHAGPG